MMPSAAEQFDLSDRIAVVTGGSRGLGREMVRAFAAAGADVVIASRKLDNCTLLAHEIEETTKRRALAVACHVGHWDDCDRLIETVYAEWGRIDVFVNNAGMSPLYGDLTEVSEALWDKVQDVNLKGPFRLAALAGARMKAAGRGSIINVSTAGSRRPAPSFLPYAAAKAGLNALTVGFAHALGPEVRVNTLMPGPFLTDVTEAWDDDQTSLANSGFALRRIGLPHEIVGAALYLASDASSFTTGATLSVDGGMP
ncbi:MAG TPA: glucose 1-dehydrogenase [Acidimicrobiales bacterium]|jgi:NAD(P)-dependent dehydrogenase (short-subunit alcohol dehydrogenase family)